MQVKEGVNVLNFLMPGSQTGTTNSGKNSDSLDFASFLAESTAASSEKVSSGSETSSSDTPGSETKTEVKNDGQKSQVDQSKETETFDDTQSKVTDSVSGETAEEITSEEVTAEETTSEEVTPEEVTSGKVISEEVISEEVISGKEIPEEVTSGKEISEEVTPGKVISEVSDSVNVPGAAEKVSTEEDAVLELVGNILQLVMEQFQLSGEELADKLEAFGMEMSDLFTKEGLRDFFLNMNAADISDLIVNEDLNQELQMFIGQFDKLMQDTEITGPDLTAYVENEDIEKLVENVPKLQDMPENDFVKPSLEIKEEEAPIISEEPEVIVTRQEKAPSSDLHDSTNEKEAKSSDSMQEQSTAQEKDVIVTKKETSFENPILQAIQDAVDQVSDVVVSEQPVEGHDVIQQIVEQIRVNMNQETTSLELQLYPEHLGKIQIHVVSKDGIMTARIVAETEAAKQAIEGGLTNLKEAMEQQELKVDAIEVMVSTTGFERGQEEKGSYEQGNASKSKRKIDLSEIEEEISKEEEAELDKMRNTGSSVSYTA